MLILIPIHLFIFYFLYLKAYLNEKSSKILMLGSIAAIPLFYLLLNEENRWIAETVSMFAFNAGFSSYLGANSRGTIAKFEAATQESRVRLLGSLESLREKLKDLARSANKTDQVEK